MKGFLTSLNFSSKEGCKSWTNCFVLMHVYYVNARGRGPDDIGGLGEEKPGEIQKEDDEFDLYRKRMMLAYRFRPNPLVRQISFLFLFFWS